MAIISFREYARQKGVNLKAIQKRIENGSITKNAIVPGKTAKNPGVHPKIDSDIADRDFAKLGNPTKKLASEARVDIQQKKLKPSDSELLRQTKKAKAIRPEVVKEEVNGQAVPVVKEPPGEVNRYVNAKATNEELKSRKIELEVLELEGRLVDVGDVTDSLEKKVQEVRAALFTTGDKIALQILGKRDLLEVKSIIKKSLNEALSALQREENDFQA